MYNLPSNDNSTRKTKLYNVRAIISTAIIVILLLLTLFGVYRKSSASRLPLNQYGGGVGRKCYFRSRRIEPHFPPLYYCDMIVQESGRYDNNVAIIRLTEQFVVSSFPQGMRPSGWHEGLVR